MKQELLTNDIVAATNSYGVKFSVGDTVNHDGTGDEEAKILRLIPSPAHEPEIMAETTRGTAHIDFLSQVE